MSLFLSLMIKPLALLLTRGLASWLTWLLLPKRWARALNSNIEQTMAGAHGRGFQVLTDVLDCLLLVFTVIAIIEAASI